MMNVLGCLDIPTYGTYLLDGTEVTDLSDRQLARIRNREIGFIFQGYNLIQELDALENVTLPLIYQGISVFEREDRAMEALERVGMADRALDSKTGRHVLEILRQLNNEGSTIILITHDDGIAAQAHRRVRLTDGKIVSDERGKEAAAV